MTTCPKCQKTSGDDWSQCDGACAMRDLLNAPRAYTWLKHLQVQHVDVTPGSTIYAILLDFARLEASETIDLVAQSQRANPITIELKTSDEARRVLEQVRSEEKETIKALADALEALGERMPHGWHLKDGDLSCTPKCEAACAALRLAGRLP